MAFSIIDENDFDFLDIILYPESSRLKMRWLLIELNKGFKGNWNPKSICGHV
jgi:hypothetical protein